MRLASPTNKKDNDTQIVDDTGINSQDVDLEVEEVPQN